MTRAVLYLAALLLCTPARANWTGTDTALELALVAVSTVDWIWMQTINFTQRSIDLGGAHQSTPVGNATHGWEEMNPILGNHPSRTKVNLFIPACILGHAAVAYPLPQPYRRIWQGVGISVEVAAVSVNAMNGVSISLPWN